MSDYAAEHKVAPYEIHEMRNTDPDFYPTIGPLLSRREVVAELGSPVWDDDDKTWVAAVPTGGGVAFGVVGLRRDEVCSFYVAPGRRGELVGAALLGRVVKLAEGRRLRATVTERAQELFGYFGFSETATRGRYRTMVREEG